MTGTFSFSRRKDNEMRKEIKAYIKTPENEPVRVTCSTLIRDIDKKVGGPARMTQLKLSTGKNVVVISDQNAIQRGRRYNFTICPTEDRRTWIDVIGPVLVEGYDQDNNLVDIELTDEEMKELFRVPYV